MMYKNTKTVKHELKRLIDPWSNSRICNIVHPKEFSSSTTHSSFLLFRRFLRVTMQFHKRYHQPWIPLLGRYLYKKGVTKYIMEKYPAITSFIYFIGEVNQRNECRSKYWCAGCSVGHRDFLNWVSRLVAVPLFCIPVLLSQLLHLCLIPL